MHEIAVNVIVHYKASSSYKTQRIDRVTLE